MQQARRSTRLATLPTIDYYAKHTYEKTTNRVVKRTKHAATVTAKRKKIPPKDTKQPKDHHRTNEVVETGPTAMVEGVVVRTFSMEEAVGHLRKVDPQLGKFMTDKEIANFVQRVQNADSSNPFRELATSIIYQQIGGNVAKILGERFVKLFDPPKDHHPRWFPTPEMVWEKPVETLKTAGLSTRKAEYIRGLAEKFINKTITMELLSTLSDEELSKLLCSVRGIGPWTVDMYLMLNLGHPDILPVTDLGVRKGVALHFGLKEKLPTPKQMQELTEHWRPYRSVGSWFMWKKVDVETWADV
ncbi:hypothetical protein O0I10_003159 [Lichtheimia ornata]|uniref:HhH-GPD domain-containing protein n=1 Tax=Lichtheimia ornata TaxID=688661 RepID=A0AAD7Y2J4_9FUNG|nr:uncharacterized protein O0I10_003159 [Lichtheimia ornata]KAJ8660937.1 hypothetical protein O0I10_003159 [Lichtheimia ornata]